MEEGVVREYVQNAQSIIEASPQMDEANTKAAVLRDFLEVLDWEIPTNTRLEYPVTVGTRTYKIDYALVLEGAPVAFIEAKGVDTSLADDHREQVAAYMKNENVTWGILTNGKEYEFLQRRVIDSDVDIQILAKTKIEQLPTRVNILEAFTKDAIQTGDSEKIATRINKLKSAQNTLENEKDSLALTIKEVLVTNVSDVISSRVESQAKEMIDRLIDDIEKEINSDGSAPLSDNGDNGSTNVLEDSSVSSDEYVISIHDANATLVKFSSNNQSDVIADTVNYLIRNHNLISRIEPMPYIPGREKAIINDRPTSPHDDNAMRTYRELIRGYYLDTNINKKGKKHEVKRLANKCNLGVGFSGEW